VKQNETLSLVKGPPLQDGDSEGALTLPACLKQAWERYNTHEALVLRTADEVVRWSYDDLWERACQIGRALIACGVGKGTRVGVLMTNRPEYVAAFFGVSMSGALLVPLSTFSTPPELAYLLEASAVTVLLVEEQVLSKNFVTLLRELEPDIAVKKPGELQSLRFPFLRYLAVVGKTPASGTIESWDRFLARGEAVPPALLAAAAATALPSDPAGLFFSSGSTSKPKGVLNSHRGIVLQFWRHAHSFCLKPGAYDVRAWAANGFFWSGNCAMVMGATLVLGGTLVLQRIFDPAEALQLMQDEKVTFPHAWPHQWTQLEGAPNFKDVNLSSIKYLDASKPLARHPTIKTTWVEPRWAYGSTETFTISTQFPSDTPPEVAGESSGAPLPGNTIKIVDPETGETQPIGERGEIAVKGPTLMLGYLGTPLDETLDDHGFFHTGDGGYIDDRGRLFWEGRLTDIIKTGGANVSPLEVDEVMAQHPKIKIGKTVGIAHETLGEMVVACVVPHEGEQLDEESVRKYLRERLASYKVPRRVMFLKEGQVAVTSTAKVKTSDLRKLVTTWLKETTPST
jgi:fatty-acyl-CoA synthase